MKHGVEIQRWDRAVGNYPLMPSWQSMLTDEIRGRTVEDAAQGFSPGARRKELTERKVNHLGVRLLLDFGRELLLLL